MNILELVIWSAMTGGLLTLMLAAMADLALNRSVASLRSLSFLLVSGCSFVLLCGLPEDLYPDLPLVPLMVLKSGLSPLSGALALTYLGRWLGESAEDRIIHYTIVWGSSSLILGAAILASLSAMTTARHAEDIFLFAAMVNGFAVLLATATAMRAAHLGDPLGHEMVVAGLNGHQIFHETTGPVVWSVTALSTIVFFLILVNLGIRHSRRNRRLERLAGLSQDTDSVTGLPQGSVLLSKVDDAFWRSTRLNTQCTVICLHLRNLYELSETAGHNIDVQILHSMTARIRRAVGFRCVVGLYHPRCFVIVISAVKQTGVPRFLMNRLRMVMSKPLDVTDSHAGNHVFTPKFHLGVVTVTPSSSTPSAAIDEAERLALTQDSDQQSEISTAY